MCKHLENKHGIIDPDKGKKRPPVPTSMLSKKQKKLPDVWRAQSLQGTPTFTSMANKRNFQLEKICKWVAKNNVPLSMVESPAFREMLTAFDNTSSVFTSRSIRSKIIELDGAI